MSLLKFVDETKTKDGANLHWSRADIDGVPFRGVPVPLKEEEYEAKTIKSFSAYNGVFYTGKKEENDKYLEVLDKTANGWWQLVHIDRYRKDGDPYFHIYVEWLEPYRQMRPNG